MDVNVKVTMSPGEICMTHVTQESLSNQIIETSWNIYYSWESWKRRGFFAAGGQTNELSHFKVE